MRWYRKTALLVVLLVLLTVPTLAAEDGWVRLEPPVSLMAAEDSTFVTAWTEDCTTYGDVLTGWAKEAYDSLTEAYAAGEERLEEDGGKFYWVVGEVLQIKNVSDTDAWVAANQDRLWAALICAGNAFTLDHPEYFWIHYDLVGRFWYDERNVYCRVDFCARTESDTVEERAALETEVEAALDDLLRDTADLPVMERLAYFDNWLCEQNSYHHDAANRNENFENSIPWNIVSGLTAIGDPVCEGYAKSFQVLCEAIGVPCVCLVSETHMWNAVRLDGVWYTVDSTWNEVSYAGVQNVDDIYSSRTYFLTAVPTDEDHMLQQLLPAPPVSNVPYFTDWAITADGLRGGERVSGSCWIALYTGEGKLLDCRPCGRIPWGIGTFMQLAPDFERADLQQAGRIVRFCLKPGGWIPALGPKEIS